MADFYLSETQAMTITKLSAEELTLIFIRSRSSNSWLIHGKKELYYPSGWLKWKFPNIAWDKYAPDYKPYSSQRERKQKGLPKY